MTGAFRLLIPGDDSSGCSIHAMGMGPNEIVVEMILLVVMLEEGGHTSHQCLPGTAFRTSSEVLTLVKNTNSFIRVFIEKLLRSSHNSLEGIHTMIHW